MKRKILLYTAISFSVLTLGLIRQAKAQEWPFLSVSGENPFLSLMQEKPIFDLSQSLNRPDFEHYLQFYGLNYPNTRHVGGYLSVPVASAKEGAPAPQPAQSEDVFVHVFEPEGDSKGTIVTMHGYFVHTGLLVHLIKPLLDQAYTVVAIDLPGHGLSGGSRANIDDFGMYSQVLAGVTEKIQSLPKPWYLVGHSTGGAGIWEYVLKNRNHPYHQVVLAAPLVRSAYWELSLFGFYLGQGWLNELPRILKPTSSDPSFVEMVRKDPLQCPTAPIQWVRALIEWNEKVVESYPPSQTPLLIIQGTEDTVVEWRYNIPFLQRKFPQSQVSYLEGAQHDLLWEAPPIRQKVFDQILNFWGSIKGLW